MIKVGLTGSIGMGKSTVAKMFKRERVPVFDADAEVHRLQGPAGALVSLIEDRFPGSTGVNGVDRARLGAAVFNNPTALKALESIVHPAIGRSRMRFLKAHRSRIIVVLDIPLLFETKGWRRVDVIVTVSAPAWKQRKRVLARKVMTKAKFAAIKRLQMPDALKRARADFIIDTGGSYRDTAQQVRALIACVQSKSGRYSRHNA